MKMTYPQSVSGDNLSHKRIYGIIIIKLKLKKWGETQKVAIKCSPSYVSCIYVFTPLPTLFSATEKKRDF